MVIESAHRLAEFSFLMRGFRLRTHDGVAAWVSGSGPPLVLLHGALSRASSTWFRVAGRLARNHRVILPDLPGFGHSRPALAEGSVTVGRVAGSLAGALEAWTCGEPFALVGESLGGWVAARVALLRPDRIRHLFLVDAAGLFPDEDYARRLAGIITPETPTDLARLFGFVADRRWSIPGLAARDMLATYRREYPALRGIIAAGEDDQLTAGELAALSVPCTVIWGEHDGLIPPETGSALAAAIPGARLVMLPCCAHVPPIQSPGRFVSTLVQALDNA